MTKNTILLFMIPTNDVRIDALVGSNPDNPGQPLKWNVIPGGTLTYSFVTNAEASTYETALDETGIQQVDEGTKNQVRQIMQTVYGTVLPINFVEDSFGQGNIRIMLGDITSIPDAGAYALGDLADPNGFQAVVLKKGEEFNFGNLPGTYEYSTLIHELGHALGLEHPGNYNAGEKNPTPPPPGRVFLPFEQDNSRNTVMSYNPGSATAGDAGAPEPQTLMPFDILALQFLYGVKNNNTGNDVYTFNDTNFKQVATIWDSGGIDTVDFSGLSADEVYTLRLAPGLPFTTQAALKGLDYNLEPSQGAPEGATYKTDTFGTYTSFTTEIENLIGTAGQDEILGNRFNNSIQSGNGNDTVYGGKGGDILDGGVGSDTIYAGREADQINGGEGDDIISGDRDNDTITGGGGNDRFILAPGLGTDTITDFIQGSDELALSGGLTFAQLAIVPQAGGSAVQISGTGEIIAVLSGTTVALGASDFTLA
ncbi:Serralysin C [Planktothrix rubescens]|nr:Serralysin C [Planktothrix rubescens]